ncbi:hypothetical protein ACVWWR_002612 [Bradyrhizobium sp. LM3.2]
MNCQSRANSFRPTSISFASLSSFMRKLSVVTVSLRAKRSNPGCLRGNGLDCFGASLLAMTESYVAFFANVALRLSNSSTFTPLRRMMKLCWSTESVLFQAQ